MPKAGKFVFHLEKDDAYRWRSCICGRLDSGKIPELKIGVFLDTAEIQKTVIFDNIIGQLERYLVYWYYITEHITILGQSGRLHRATGDQGLVNEQVDLAGHDALNCDWQSAPSGL